MGLEPERVPARTGAVAKETPRRPARSSAPLEQLGFTAVELCLPLVEPVRRTLRGTIGPSARTSQKYQRPGGRACRLMFSPDANAGGPRLYRGGGIAPWQPRAPRSPLAADLVVLPRRPLCVPGELVVLPGRLHEPSGFEAPQGRIHRAARQARRAGHVEAVAVAAAMDFRTAAAAYESVDCDIRRILHR